MRARRHLQVETAEGIPDDAVLSGPSGDMLRRYPIAFAVTWTEDL